MIAMIATIDELFLLSDRSDRSDHSDGSDHMETRLHNYHSNLVSTTNVQQFFFIQILCVNCYLGPKCSLGVSKRH